MKKPNFYLGIDGGGTKTKARLEDADGKLLGEGIAGASNLVRGATQAIDAFLSASQLAFEDANIDPALFSDTTACIGVAGATVEPHASDVKQWQHPFKQLKITTDLHIALAGAHNGSDGAVIITGTGFCAGIQHLGHYEEIGGHGLLLGDGGSGAKLGLTAIRLTLEALDGVIAHTPLTQHILQSFNCEDAKTLVTLSISKHPSFFASLAPIVFEYADKGDAIAMQVVTEIATFTGRYIHRLMDIKKVRLSIIGGISNALMPYLAKDARALCSPSLSEPDLGAVLLARSMVK